MKKVLIFSLSYYPRFVGGAEVAIKEITDRLYDGKNQEKDFEFDMITLRNDSNLPRFEKVGNVNIHRILFSKPDISLTDMQKFPYRYNKHLYLFAAAFYALRLQSKNRYDMCWAMMAHSAGVPAGIFKFFNPKVKYILTLQEGDPTEYIEKIAKPIWPLFKYGFTSADVIQSISNYLQSWATRMGNKNKKVVIPNGVDVHIFTETYSQQDLQEIKNKLHISHDDFVIITTSRLVHKNAIDDVINAIKLLNNPKYKFLILGDGADKQKLENLTKELQIQDQIQFIGQIDQKQISKYLKVSDVFARPSRSEGMGNSFIEAMAAGLPVIATREGGLADFIVDNETAYVVQKDNPQSIANAIKKVESDENLKNKIINNAHNLAIRDYDWDDIVEKMKREVFDN